VLPLRTDAQVDAAAWRAFCAALRSDCDALAEGCLLVHCGVRVFDVRSGTIYAIERAGRTFRKLHVLLKVLVFPFFFPLMLLYGFVYYLYYVTTVLEALLFVPLRLLAQLCCGVPFSLSSSGAPLLHIGAEARNAAHVARRTALIDGFAKAHSLVISYECAEYTGWRGGSRSDNKFATMREPALRVRLATPDGPPAGLLQGDVLV
jgi:hypothetical protein